MDRNDAEEIARGTGWLSLQSGEFQRRLLTVAELCHFPPGRHVYDIGDRPDSVFALVEGELSILRPSGNFSLQLVHVARPVWWVGEAAVITDTARRATRRQYSAEEKIRIVLDGLRGESSIAELCRKEGINQNLYYRWSKEFLEAGRKRLAGDTAREANSDEVKELRSEAALLKEALAETLLENRLLKKSSYGAGGDDT
jgi:transposase